MISFNISWGKLFAIFICLAGCISLTVFWMQEQDERTRPVTGSTGLIRELEADTNGNGEIENIAVYGTARGYELRITQAGGETVNVSDLGPCLESSSLYVEVLDMNKDNVPEIITRVQGDKCHETNILRWNGAEYAVVLQGDFISVWYSDWNNDGILEVIAAQEMATGVFHERVYKWNGKKFEPIYYRINASSSRSSVGGFHHIEDFIDIMNKSWDLKAPDITHGVTGEWETDEEQQEILHDLCSNLLSAQIEEVVSYDTKSAGVEWEIVLTLYKTDKGKLYSEQCRLVFSMEKVTSPVTLEGDYLIDELEILSSKSDFSAMSI